MEEFFIADTHFNHKRILMFNNRPWNNIEDMNNGLIENWNNTVPKRNSLVYIIGDFAFSDHKKFLYKLNGKKILIQGSHDHMNQDIISQFKNVVPKLEFKRGPNYFVLNHTCMRIWERSHYGSIHLFGHSHGRLKTYNLSFDVGVDVSENNYSPIHIDDIIKRASIRRKQMFKNNRIDKTVTPWKYEQDDVRYIFNKLKNN